MGGFIGGSDSIAQPLSTMPATKRMKLELEAPPEPAAVTGSDPCCKSEDYELVKCDEDEGVDGVAEGDTTYGDPAQLASYSPFLARKRDFYGLAVSLMRLQA